MEETNNLQAFNSQYKLNPKVKQKPELRALSAAIHVVGERHTDGTWGAEGPAHQFVRLAFLGELVSLKVDEVTFWG